MKRWWKKAARFVTANWRTAVEWYLEREKLKQIKRREELGDL